MKRHMFLLPKPVFLLGAMVLSSIACGRDSQVDTVGKKVANDPSNLLLVREISGIEEAIISFKLIADDPDCGKSFLFIREGQEARTVVLEDPKGEFSVPMRGAQLLALGLKNGKWSEVVCLEPGSRQIQLHCNQSSASVIVNVPRDLVSEKVHVSIQASWYERWGDTQNKIALASDFFLREYPIEGLVTRIDGLPPGLYDLALTGQYCNEEISFVQVGEGEEIPITFQGIQGGFLELTVCNTSQEKMDRALVWLAQGHFPMRWDGRDLPRSTRGPVSGITDRSGKVVIGPIIPGKYYLIVSHAYTYPYYSQNEVEIKGGTLTQINQIELHVQDFLK